MLELAKSFRRMLEPLLAFPDPEVDLETHILRGVDERPPGRRSDWFRIGGVNNSYECDRRVLYSRIEKIYTDRQKRDPRFVLLMDMGNAIHDMMQSNLLAKTGRLYGEWRCPSCHRRYDAKFIPMPKPFCPNHIRVTDENGVEVGKASCEDQQAYLKSRGKPYWLYEEFSIKDVERNLSGRVDGIWYDGSRWYIIEIKSVSEEVFNNLRKIKITREQAKAIGEVTARYILIDSMADLPKNDHIRQAAIYGGLLQEMALFDPSFPFASRDFGGVLITYVNRNSAETKVFKKANIDGVFADADETIKRRLDALAAADLEPREDPVEEQKRVEANRKIGLRFQVPCRDRNHRIAKECPWRLVCFPYKDETKNKVEFLTEKDDGQEGPS